MSCLKRKTNRIPVIPVILLTNLQKFRLHDSLKLLYRKRKIGKSFFWMARFLRITENAKSDLVRRPHLCYNNCVINVYFRGRC